MYYGMGIRGTTGWRQSSSEPSLLRRGCSTPGEEGSKCEIMTAMKSDGKISWESESGMAFLYRRTGRGGGTQMGPMIVGSSVRDSLCVVHSPASSPDTDVRE